MKKISNLYYRRKGKTIIIEQKINGVTKYIKTLPRPEVMLQKIEELGIQLNDWNEEDERDLCQEIIFRYSGRCRSCGESYLPKNKIGQCWECMDKTSDPEIKKGQKIEVLYHIPYSRYKEIVKECFVCGFKQIVHLHHMDGNHSNVDDYNLVGLCPNHHALIHIRKDAENIKSLILAKMKEASYFNEGEKKEIDPKVQASHDEVTKALESVFKTTHNQN